MEPFIYKTNASGIRVAHANPAYDPFDMKTPEDLIEEGWHINIVGGTIEKDEGGPVQWIHKFKWNAIKGSCIRSCNDEGFLTHWECIEDMTEKLTEENK